MHSMEILQELDSTWVGVLLQFDGHRIELECEQEFVRDLIGLRQPRGSLQEFGRSSIGIRQRYYRSSIGLRQEFDRSSIGIRYAFDRISIGIRAKSNTTSIGIRYEFVRTPMGNRQEILGNSQESRSEFDENADQAFYRNSIHKKINEESIAARQEFGWN